jgi:hypothetical protein
MIAILPLSALCVLLSAGLAAVLRLVGQVRILTIQFTYSLQQFVAFYDSRTDLQS